MIWKYLKDQRGQFFWGPVMGGIGRGIERGLDIREKKRLEDRDEPLRQLSLQEKMLGMKKLERGEREAAERAAGLQELIDLQGGVPQQLTVAPETGMVGQVPAPMMQPAPPVAIPEKVQATPQQQGAALLRAFPEKAGQQMAEQLWSEKSLAGTSGSVNAAFPTAEAAIAFQNSPQFKTLYPTGARLKQTSKGFQFEALAPVNVAANEYHRVLASTGNEVLARQAFNNIIFGQGAMTGAGRERGEQAAFFDQPQVAPPPAMPGAPVAPGRIAGEQPGTVTQAPPEPLKAPYPTSPSTGMGPRAGETPGQAKARIEAQQRGRGTREAEAQEALAGLEIASGLVGELDALSKGIFTTAKDAGVLERGMTAGKQYLQSWDPASEMGIYTARKQTVGENLARQIGGVRGTATEGDIYRMLTALPKPGDNEASRRYKIQAFQEIINLSIAAKKRFLAGEPINLEEARANFGRLANEFVSGKYVLGSAQHGRGGQGTTGDVPEAKMNFGGKDYEKRNGVWGEVRKAY